MSQDQPLFNEPAFEINAEQILEALKQDAKALLEDNETDCRFLTMLTHHSCLC